MNDSEIDSLINQSKDYTNEPELPQLFVDQQLNKLKPDGVVELDNIYKGKDKVKKMKKIRAKKRTLDEFKNWLEGLSEFQSDDWVPSRDQWEHIKASIAVIKEPEIIKSSIGSVIEQKLVQPKTYVQPVQSSLDINPTSIRPGVNQHIDMRKPQAITQDIDTSDGNYTSDFE